MPRMSKKGIYRMPAEWEPQKSTWIAWPHNKKDWPGKFEQIPIIFSKIVAEISKVQSVNILAKEKSDFKNAQIFFILIYLTLISYKLILY